jgi:putative ABC transport system permease protein
MIKPVLVAGRWLLPDDDDAIVLNTTAAEREPDLRVGDEVVFKIGKKETTWRVVGMVRATLTGPLAYANQPALSRVTQAQGLANRVQVATTGHSPAAQAAAAQSLKAGLEEAGLQVSAAEPVASTRERANRQVDVVVYLMVAMAVLMAVVGGLGLMGTMGVNVLERSREIGVLRAIGASSSAMLRIVVAEGLLIGLLSWLAGAALSVPISKLMADAVGRSLLNAQLDFAFSTRGALFWLLVVLALAALGSAHPPPRAARRTDREELANE